MKEYYEQLIKPWWSPPAWVFGPAWTFLYTLIFITYGFTFYYVIRKKIPMHIGFVLILNLIFNFSFTPVQFGLKNNLLATIDAVLLLITIILSIVWLYPHSKTLSLLQLPYLIWVSFATVLQSSITYLNWSR
ncbi:MAG: tryptophan-rich sensory protein [Candidatus Hydrogenedentes bacterium]|nr:tryptophan-rich sensory protein [Candidatus Hydrogenedentota bacterium]